MSILHVTLALLVAVTALCWLAGRARIAWPIALVVAGLVVAMIPGLPRIELDPQVVFLLFLPPLLYRAAAMTNWRQFERNIGPIVFLAVGLVLVTMLLVALVAYYVFEVRWTVAFLLGAIVSPTDALAATVIMRHLRVPRRLAAIVEGESLVNDAAALVAYRYAILAVMTGSFSMWRAGSEFLLDSAGGVAIGMAVAVVTRWVRPRLGETTLVQVMSLLTPFAAYIPADALGLSGVLSVVACGLMSGARPAAEHAHFRLSVFPMWDFVEFVLNGIGFILIGMQLPFAIEGLTQYRAWELAFYTVLVAITTIVVRAIWVVAGKFILRRRKQTDIELPQARGFGFALVITWSGMRGLVSLAAALAVPRFVHSGMPFPNRHLIVYVTFGVVLITLVVQGLTLPIIIRKLGLASSAEEEQNEEITARYRSVEAAIERLHQITERNDTPPGIVRAVRKRYEDLQHQLGHAVSGEDHYYATPKAHLYVATRRDVLVAMHQRLDALMNDGVIGLETWLRLSRELDLEDSRLSGFDMPPETPSMSMTSPPA